MCTVRLCCYCLYSGMCNDRDRVSKIRQSTKVAVDYVCLHMFVFDTLKKKVYWAQKPRPCGGVTVRVVSFWLHMWARYLVLSVACCQEDGRVSYFHRNPKRPTSLVSFFLLHALSLVFCCSNIFACCFLSHLFCKISPYPAYRSSQFYFAVVQWNSQLWLWFQLCCVSQFILFEWIVHVMGVHSICMVHLRKVIKRSIWGCYVLLGGYDLFMHRVIAENTEHINRREPKQCICVTFINGHILWREGLEFENCLLDI